MKLIINFSWVAVIFLAFSCSSKSQLVDLNSSEDSDISWYLNPEQNNQINIYGFGEGYTLEQATKSALSDASARLSVTISSTSNLLLEENKLDSNSEFRKKISQNIEAIQFPSYETIRTGKKGQNIYVQVKINRDQFVSLQKEKITFLNNKINNLSKSIDGQNIIKKRSSYNNIIKLGKECEILTRIVYGSQDGHLKKILDEISTAQYKLSKITDKYQFYFKSKSDSKIFAVITKHLNRKGVSISAVKNNSPEQIVMDIKTTSNTNKVYGAYITKLKINFNNLSKNKIVASNIVEITGSSTLGRNESYDAAIKNLDSKMKNSGVFKVLGLE